MRPSLLGGDRIMHHTLSIHLTNNWVIVQPAGRLRMQACARQPAARTQTRSEGRISYVV